MGHKLAHADIIDIESGAVPQNQAAERAAVSCAVQNPEVIQRITWTDDMFFDAKHRVIMAAAKRCQENGVGGDFFALLAELTRSNHLAEIGGDAELMAIWTDVAAPSVAIAQYHRGILVDCMRYRHALEAVTTAQESFRRGEGSVADVATALQDIAMQVERPRKTLNNVILELCEELERTDPPEAFSTGIPALDRATGGGPKRGELTTISAETSGGKSILLAQLARIAAEANHPVLFFSLEMPARSVLKRMLSGMLGHRLRSAHEGAVKEDMSALSQGVSRLARVKLQIEDGYSDWESIESAVREYAGKGLADVIVVDYIQLVHLREMARNETREQLVSEVARRLKALSLSLNASVLTASQVNEQGMLRESRAIGHHSDHVWTLRHSPEDGSWLTLDKNRNGERHVAIPIYMDGAKSIIAERTDS